MAHYFVMPLVLMQWEAACTAHGMSAEQPTCCLFLSHTTYVCGGERGWTSRGRKKKKEKKTCLHCCHLTFTMSLTLYQDKEKSQSWNRVRKLDELQVFRVMAGEEKMVFEVNIQNTWGTVWVLFWYTWNTREPANIHKPNGMSAAKRRGEKSTSQLSSFF